MTQANNQQARSHFSSEYNLNSAEQIQFWQGITESTLSTAEGIELAYGFILHPNSTRAVVISNGRVESYEKYRELIFDIYHQGYSVYALDHRGQGLSSRVTRNPHQGHIDSFDDYVSDFSVFIETIVQPKQHCELFLVGHSMGCVIATLYMHENPNIFSAAVYSAPMFGIRLPMNKRFIRWLAGRLNSYEKNDEPNYILGGTDYRPKDFEDNELTHSQKRYEAYRQLYRQRPELQLGSPTNHWLLESLDASERSIAATRAFPTPILILQAEEDTVVANEAQRQACQQNCEIKVIEGARHEIFIETDTRRDQALGALFHFLRRWQAPRPAATETLNSLQTQAD